MLIDDDEVNDELRCRVEVRLDGLGYRLYYLKGPGGYDYHGGIRPTAWVLLAIQLKIPVERLLDQYGNINAYRAIYKIQEVMEQDVAEQQNRELMGWLRNLDTHGDFRC